MVGEGEMRTLGPRKGSESTGGNDYLRATEGPVTILLSLFTDDVKSPDTVRS